MTKNTIVGDSSPLIALAIIGQLDLLVKLYQRVVIPEKVWEEITIHGKGLPGAGAISQVVLVLKLTNDLFTAILMSLLGA